jgi:hypothetical protein
MEVCVRVFYVCAILRVDRGLGRADLPFKGSYRLCIWLRKWRSSQGPTKGRRTLGEWMNTLNGWGGGERVSIATSRISVRRLAESILVETQISL